MNDKANKGSGIEADQPPHSGRHRKRRMVALRVKRIGRNDRLGQVLTSSVCLALFLFIPPATAQNLPAESNAKQSLQNRLLSVDAAPDLELKQRLGAIFSRIDEFKEVRVDVEDGVVKLSGAVLRAKDRLAAEDMVARFKDVVYVVNSIEEKTDVEMRVNPAIKKIEQNINKAMKYLPLLIVAAVIIFLFWLLAHYAARWEVPYRRFGINPLLRNLIHQILRAAIMLTGVILALDILDLTTLVGALAGTAGVAGLAVGFAFRDIVENYLAGVLLSIRSPFAINDLVQIGTHEGKVVRLTSREMVLMTLDGNHVVIPNSTVFKTTIYNYTRNPMRRFAFHVGVGVTEDLARVQEVGCNALRRIKGVVSDPGPFMRVEELADFNVVVKFFGWVDQRQVDFLKVQSEAIRVVKAALDGAGVEMPEPTQKVRFYPLPPEEAQAVSRTPPATLAQVEQAAAEADVSPDTYLDKQIKEDQAQSDEENILVRPVRERP